MSKFFKIVFLCQGSSPLLEVEFYVLSSIIFTLPCSGQIESALMACKCGVKRQNKILQFPEELVVMVRMRFVHVAPSNFEIF